MALSPSAAGILAWMIAGCLDWQKNGLTIPRDVVTASEEYLGSEDDFTEWLESSFEKDPQSKTATGVLWASWEANCYRKGLNPGSLTRTFPRELKKRGFKRASLSGHTKDGPG